MTHITNLRFATRGAIVAVVMLLGACGRPAGRQLTAHASAPASPEDAYSLYDLGSTWRDQAGASRPLGALRGRPRVVAMVYAHCTSTCPLAIAEMKRLESATDARLGFVLVTLDPARDTPAALAAYAAEHGLDAARWTLLSGTDDDVRELAATVGVRYRRTSPDELAHSSTLFLLDTEGRIVQRQDGLDDGGALLTTVHSLLP